MKGYSAITILIVTMLMFSGCDTIGRREAVINMDKMYFAFNSHLFEFQMVIDGEMDISGGRAAWNATHPLSPYFDPFYTELVFVHSQEDAQGFPDNVIVAWPWDIPATQGRVNRLNSFVSRNEVQLRNLRIWGREPISLEDFGLTYPITIADLVDNWEKVVDVWNALTTGERMSIV